MNKGARGLTVAAVVAAASLAAGAGFLAGRSSSQPAKDKPAASTVKERKVLYYRNPMGLADTSPVPKKDSMGMDYLPVYADEQEAAPVAQNLVSISPEKIQLLGVRAEAALVTPLERSISAAARIEVDERRVHAIAPKFEGYIERLHVNATGQTVGRGQALFEVYGPELVSAQREYVLATQGVEALRGASEEARAGMRQLADASLARLRNWDIPEDQLRALARTGEIHKTMTVRSPAAGIVTEKKAVQGQRFQPGDSLYQVSDLSSVWAIAEIFEQDLAVAKQGAKATVAIDAYPGQVFEGKVSYIYPTVNAETRTIPVRVELANPGGLLKPGMFARITLRQASAAAALTVPSSAIIDSGTRRIVLVQHAGGRFEAREVRTGARAGERVEILEGVNAGESVVVAANFLIDAESNLKSVINGLGHSGHAAPAPAQKADTPTAAPAADAAHAGHPGH